MGFVFLPSITDFLSTYCLEPFFVSSEFEWTCFSHRHFSSNGIGILCIPETDFLKDMVWAEKTFVASPLGKIKVGELSPISCFFSSNSLLLDYTET